MDTNTLFASALQLTRPWKVVESRFEKESGELRLRLDFEAGSYFPCPQCGCKSPVHDTQEKSWRHLNFWQYRTELTARTPRIDCPEHKVLLIEAPWARPESGFTLMMEAFIMLLSQQMPVSDVAEMLEEHDTRLWRVVGHYVEQAQRERSWKEVSRILVDETSARRGHRYVTNIVDAMTHDLLMMVEGRSSQALKEFAEEMTKHEAQSAQIKWIGMDMSPAYIKGAAQNFPWAKVVFDRFHVMQLAGQAVDMVRKALQQQGADLKGQRWALLGNEWTRSQEQQMARRELCNLYPKLGRAIGLRDMLQDVLEEGDEEALRWWCARAGRSRLEPFKKLAKTLRAHWDGLTAYFESGITSAAIEAVNGCIQLAKRLARGFRSFRYFRWMAYLKAGGLHLNLPSLSST